MLLLSNVEAHVIGAIPFRVVVVILGVVVQTTG
jgi:hypothetical protein